MVDNNIVKPVNDYAYILFYKPKGCITTSSDEKGRKTIYDYLQDLNVPHLIPVGRLDYDTEGMLIMTNDGDLAYKLTHPSYEIPKTYLVKVDGEMPEQKLLILRSGDAKAAAEYDGQTITGAARRVVCMSSSHVAMLDAIDCADRIAGVSGKRYITNLRISGSDKVCDVGYDPNLDFERIVSLRPDIVLLYGVAGENTATTAKLRAYPIYI